MPQIGVHPQQAGCQDGPGICRMGEGVSLPQQLSFLIQSQGHHVSHSSAFERELEPSDPPGDSGVSGMGWSLTVAQPLASWGRFGTFQSLV